MWKKSSNFLLQVILCTLHHLPKQHSKHRIAFLRKEIRPHFISFIYINTLASIYYVPMTGRVASLSMTQRPQVASCKTLVVCLSNMISLYAKTFHFLTDRQHQNTSFCVPINSETDFQTIACKNLLMVSWSLAWQDPSTTDDSSSNSLGSPTELDVPPRYTSSPSHNAAFTQCTRSPAPPSHRRT